MVIFTRERNYIILQYRLKEKYTFTNCCMVEEDENDRT